MICSLCSLRSLTATYKGLRSHRCSWWTVSPDIFGAPGRGHRGCANLIRRSRGRNLQQLHQLRKLHRHAAEEESFGCRRLVRVDPTTTRTNGWWGRRWRKGGRRRGNSRRRQVQGQDGRPSPFQDFGVRARTTPLSGGAGPAVAWYPGYHTLAGTWPSRRITGRSRPMPRHEQGAVAGTGNCSF